MKSAVAIITYNRIHALKAELEGLLKHCGQYQVGIFEDCGQKDGTQTWLMGPGAPVDTPELLAVKYSGEHIGRNVESYLGTVNLGVTGNSNRAIRWFMNSNCDHLVLLNDDLLVLGNFVDFYARGHEDLGVGLFCFCDFTQQNRAISGRAETYRWLTVNCRGWRVKLLPRMTGIMMSFTREVVEKIGYYDARFGRFGEEHCDYTIRARMAGFINLDGQRQNCLDLEANPALLTHQDVETSLGGAERQAADQEASIIMNQICRRYGQEPLFRPFYLRVPIVGGPGGFGIPAKRGLTTGGWSSTFTITRPQSGPGKS
jgi:hypothetical protein